MSDNLAVTEPAPPAIEWTTPLVAEAICNGMHQCFRETVAVSRGGTYIVLTMQSGKKFAVTVSNIRPETES